MISLHNLIFKKVNVEVFSGIIFINLFSFSWSQIFPGMNKKFFKPLKFQLPVQNNKWDFVMFLVLEVFAMIITGTSAIIGDLLFSPGFRI